MVSGLHDWMGLEFFTPDFGLPITDSQEELRMGGVTLDAVNWRMMLSRLDTEALVDLDLLASLVCLEDVTLFGSDQELEWTVLAVVFKTGSSENLGNLLFFDVEGLFKFELFSWSIIEHFHVPPENSTVSGCGDELSTRLSGAPVHIVDWVVMRELELGSVSGLQLAISSSLLHIEEGECSIVRTTGENISDLRGEGHSAEG